MITKEEWLEAVNGHEPFEVYIEKFDERFGRGSVWFAVNGFGREVLVASCFWEGIAEEIPLEQCSIVKKSKGIPSVRIDEKTFWENIERISEAAHGKKEV